MTQEQRRIGIDCREAFRDEPRGIGVYCRNLVRGLAEACDDMDFALYHERDVPPDMRDLPERLHANQLGMKGARWHLWERIALPMRLISDGIELFHGTYNTLPPRPPVGRGPKLVVTIHDVIATWWDDDHGDPYVRYVRRVTPRVVRQADAIITISDFSKADIIERFGVEPDRVHVIRNGLHPLFANDTSQTRAAARDRFAGGRPYLFAIGAALARKNTDVLFPMLRRLIDAGDLHDEVLVVSGLSGDALTRRRASAEAAGVVDRVRFLGYQTEADLRELFSGAELFVYPTFAEGWGLPIIEALACGTPVATSRTTAMPEAGGAHARYFDPHDLDSIVATVQQCLRERESFARSRDVVVARARAFTWHRTAERVAALYREVLAG